MEYDPPRKKPQPINNEDQSRVKPTIQHKNLPVGSVRLTRTEQYFVGQKNQPPIENSDNIPPNGKQ